MNFIVLYDNTIYNLLWYKEGTFLLIENSATKQESYFFHKAGIDFIKNTKIAINQLFFKVESWFF